MNGTPRAAAAGEGALVTYAYHAQILADIQVEADYRTMVWIYNHSSCPGSHELMSFNDYDMARIPTGTAAQIKDNVIAAGPKKIYFVDLARVRGSDHKIHQLFSALKEIKNGFVTGAKGGELLMEPPHLFVFSDVVPDMKIASPDRWKIYTLYNVEEDIQMRLLTTDEVAKIYKEQTDSERCA